MVSPSSEKIVQSAVDLGLLEQRQVREVWAALGNRSMPAEEFTQFLVRREFLTNYQIDRILKGEKTGFFYGPYVVLYPVGEGTFAQVFRAVNKKTGEIVALKVLKTKYGENQAQFNQFLREGKVGASLQHPNIVRIFDVAAEGDTLYMVMEFVEGRTLHEFIRVRKKLEPLEATRIMTDVTEGLRYAFENGLTHRDMKMTNVLISSKGQAKLVDFGLATVDQLRGEGSRSEYPNSRSVDYAALERTTGVRRDDVRSDIYFLGCIYYHMLTGHSPLPETQDRITRLSGARFRDITPIRTIEPDIPDAVVLVVNKAMMLDAGRRYQSPSAMLLDLQIAMSRLSQEASGAARSKQQDAENAPQYAVMVVESNVKMQDIFREGLRKAGYRTLVIADPSRALERFRVDNSACDLVIFNAQELGNAAVTGFNALADRSSASRMPAILLLDEHQKTWEDRAQTADWRIVLKMPITMGQLRESIAKLIAASKPKH